MLLLWPKHMPLEGSRDWQDMSVDDWGVWDVKNDDGRGR